jgi:hypothetical protein
MPVQAEVASRRRQGDARGGLQGGGDPRKRKRQGIVSKNISNGAGAIPPPAQFRGGHVMLAHSRPAGRDHHRDADGGGDGRHLRRRGSSLRHRPSIGLAQWGKSIGRTGCLILAAAPCSISCAIQPDLGAGTVHLSVRLDGEVRRRLWRTHRHPCRRRCRGQEPCPASRRIVCCSRCWRARCSPSSSARSAPALSGTSAIPIRSRPISKMPMWLVYLAVPLGSYLMCFRFLQVAWNFLRTGELPHHDHAHVEGLEDERRPCPAPCTGRCDERAADDGSTRLKDRWHPRPAG